MLAILIYARVGVFIHRASTNYAPVLARAEEQRREKEFLDVTARSADMVAASCPDSPTEWFIQQTETSALFHSHNPESAWELICKRSLTPTTIPPSWLFTLNWCQFLDDMVTRRSVEGSGRICVDADHDWPYGRQYRFDDSEMLNRWRYWPDKGRLNIGNVRFKVEHCGVPRAVLNSRDVESCVVTVWAATQRRSWGQYLIDETRTRFSVELWIVAVMAGGALALVLFVCGKAIGLLRRGLSP